MVRFGVEARRSFGWFRKLLVALVVSGVLDCVWLLRMADVEGAVGSVASHPSARSALAIDLGLWPHLVLAPLLR